MKRTVLGLVAMILVALGCAALKPAVDPTLIAGELTVCTENNTDGCAYVKCCLGVCQKYNLDPAAACALDVCKPAVDGGQ